MKKELIIVLGMHRSGTSAMTKALETLGVSLSDNVIPAIEGINDRGFWEDQDIVAINEELLRETGGFWFSPTKLQTAEIGKPELNATFQKAKKKLQDTYAVASSWGFKDPRVARLLPFWLSVAEHVDIKPKFIFMARHPVDVAASLNKRDGLLEAHSDSLWLRHVVENVTLVSDFENCVVDYSQLLSKPKETIYAISASLNLEPNQTAVEDYCANYLDPALCHSSTSKSVSPQAGSPSGDIYEWLYSRHGKTISHEDLRSWNALLEQHKSWFANEHQCLSESLSVYSRNLVDLYKDTCNEFAAISAEYQTQKHQNEQALSSLRTLVERHEKQLVENEKQLIENEKRFEEYEVRLVDYDRHVTNITAERDALVKLLHDVRNSRSWKVTAPYRVARQLVSRPLMSRVGMAVKARGGILPMVKSIYQIAEVEGLAGLKLRYSRLLSPQQSQMNPSQVEDSYQSWVERYSNPSFEELANQKQQAARFSLQPKISILMPVYNVRTEYLDAAVKSVMDQSYSNWELCIADDCSTDKSVLDALRKHESIDSRIKVVYREQNGHISAATNSALDVATGEFIALMDNDDLISPDALFHVVSAINKTSDAKLLYSDEDKISEDGTRRFDAYFKSDWNPILNRSQNAVSHFGVYAADIAREIGGFRVGFEGAQDWDFMLRFSEQISPHQIVHIPHVLYHWRVIEGSTAAGGDEKPYALIAGQKAVSEHLERLGIKAEVSTLDTLHYVKVKYEVAEPAPMVSLIIPTRNGLEVLKTCIDSIYEKTTYPNYEIIVVDNGSDDPETIDYLKQCEKNHCNFKVLHDGSPFNYSALNNKAAAIAAGEYLALVNNDVEVITPDWLDEMMGYATQPGIGCVGARLWYPDDTLQHGGVIMVGGVAGHAHKYIGKHDLGYFSRAVLPQNYLAVTAACLVVKKSIFDQVGGLNEKDLTVAFNDIDFCLRVFSAGYLNAWTPYAELYHYESKTRGHEDTPEKKQRFAKEVSYMQSTWGGLLKSDPYYNLNLDDYSENFALAAKPRHDTVKG